MTTRSIVWPLAAVFCAAFALPTEAAEKVRLRDKPIVLQALQFGATLRADHDLAVVSSGLVGAGVILPYSDEWEFEIRDDGSVTGGDTNYQFSLAAWESTAATEKDYLQAILQRLESSSGPHLRNVSFLESDSDLVLRYQSQPKHLPEDVRPSDPWWWHYWSAEKVEHRWADAHLTVLEPSKELPENDAKLTTFLSKGLRALPTRPPKDD